MRYVKHKELKVFVGLLVFIYRNLDLAQVLCQQEKFSKDLHQGGFPVFSEDGHVKGWTAAPIEFLDFGTEFLYARKRDLFGDDGKGGIVTLGDGVLQHGVDGNSVLFADFSALPRDSKAISVL